MGTVYMNARCKKIMNLLLVDEGYISLQRIADATKVSKRSIYYDLCKINEWMSFYSLPEIEVERGKGLRILPGDKAVIEDILSNEGGKERYIFSPMERVKIIICYIIHLGEPVYIEQLSEYCQVSRNTIFNDLRVVVSQLQEYNLALVYESKKGYRIEGDIIRVRALFFLYFNTLLPLFDSGVLNFINSVEIRQYFTKLKEIEQELRTEYVDGILLSLAALLPLMYKGRERPYFPDLRREEIERTQELKLVRAYFPDIDESEQIYLCLHLLGSRVAVAGNEMFDNPANQTVYEITKALVAEFEKIACVIFEDKEGLERALFIHISTSLYRYQYGIQIGNPIREDVMREYPNLVDITRVVSKYLFRIVGLPIPDSEVAYLALHFGAHLKISRPANEKLRVLIVCVNGVSTGNMLRREVQKLLPHAQIVDVVAAVDVINIQSVCDLVISTVKIKSKVPAVVVHPILTDFDRKAILNHTMSAPKKLISESDELFEILKKYVRPEDYGNLKLDLVSYFHGADREVSQSHSKLGQGLAEFLTRDRIVITTEPFMWQGAVRFAGQSLVAAGSIEPRYLDTIISQIRYYGPYMFITKGLVLAHAKPEDGVKHLDVSLTVFKKPVVFSETHEAWIIITLAAEDQEKHLKILKDIMQVFSDEKRHSVAEIAQLTEPSEILSYIKTQIGE